MKVAPIETFASASEAKNSLILGLNRRCDEQERLEWHSHQDISKDFQDVKRLCGFLLKNGDEKG